MLIVVLTSNWASIFLVVTWSNHYPKWNENPWNVALIYLFKSCHQVLWSILWVLQVHVSKLHLYKISLLFIHCNILPVSLWLLKMGLYNEFWLERASWTSLQLEGQSKQGPKQGILPWKPFNYTYLEWGLDWRIPFTSSMGWRTEWASRKLRMDWLWYGKWGHESLLNAEPESERNHRHQDKTSALGLLFFCLSQQDSLCFEAWGNGGAWMLSDFNIFYELWAQWFFLHIQKVESVANASTWLLKIF